MKKIIVFFSCLLFLVISSKAETRVDADFDLDYIYETPLRTNQFDTSNQTVYPFWWIELENKSEAGGDNWEINSLTFQAPYELFNFNQEPNDINGFNYTWHNITLAPGEKFEIDEAEQNTLSKVVHIPYTATRSFTGSVINGEGDLTTTVTVIPEAGISNFDVEIYIYAAQSDEAWKAGNFFGTLSYVSSSCTGGTYKDFYHEDEPVMQGYDWAFNNYVPGQQLTFTVTIHVKLNDDFNWAVIEPEVNVSGDMVADRGSENWVNNILQLPDEGGTIIIDSAQLVNRIGSIPWIGVYMPQYVDLGFTVSGKITDKATTLPLANVRVGCWNNDFEIWTETRTDVNGIYRLTNLPPGTVDLQIQPESYYAYMGVSQLELEEDINNLDFALPKGATLCGKVIDSKTAEPLASIKIEYSHEKYAAYKNSSTDVDGTFCLTQLPPGIAELKVEPDVDSGYAWNLPWESDWVCLGEGENRLQRIIALEKGALVRGHIKDANGNVVSGIEYYYTGRDCDGWGNVDVNGFYQIRLPVGIYGIALDGSIDEFGALPAIVTITAINNDVNVPDIIAYTEETGGQISGEVNNPGGYAKTGCFLVIAFEAGTPIDDPNAWYIIGPAIAEMKNAGPFSLNKLPPDVNYDIYLLVDNQTPDLESFAVRDSALNVSIGTTNINLEYNSQGSMVRGSVKNADGKPVLGAEALLADSSNSFRGFGNTDCNGQYIIYNVPAGTYTVTAERSKYLNTSTTVAVVDGISADVNTIIMPFAGEKEGADLNGDGEIDMLDVLEFSNTWLQSGSSEADFNQDSRVNFKDWVRMAENWQSKAIWYSE